MSIGDVLGVGGGLVCVLFTLIQIAPIKIDPWSYLAKQIGRAINADVLQEISEIKNQQCATQDELDKHIQDYDERNATMHRQRILQFNNELVRGGNYTHECFNDMLLEIDEYEAYCTSHPGYKNNRAGMAISNIKRVYSQHEIDGGFLT